MSEPCQTFTAMHSGPTELQILVDSRTSLLLDSHWQLRQVVEQCCNVLPLQEILLTKGAI